MDVQTYPTKKVIICYALFTGLISGLLVGAPMWLLAVIEGNKFGQLILPFAIVGGVFLGFIPSLILGIFLSKIEFYILNKRSWFRLFEIASIYSIFYTVIYLIFNDFSESWDSVLLMSLGVVIVYTMSTLIVGKFVLPKAKS